MAEDSKAVAPAVPTTVAVARPAVTTVTAVPRQEALAARSGARPTAE